MSSKKAVYTDVKIKMQKEAIRNGKAVGKTFSSTISINFDPAKFSKHHQQPQFKQ